MLSQRYCIYLARDPSAGRLFLSVSPRPDFSRCVLAALSGRDIDLLILTGPLPLGIADYAARHAAGEAGVPLGDWFPGESGGRFGFFWGPRDSSARIRSAVSSALRDLGYDGVTRVGRLAYPGERGSTTLPEDRDLDELEGCLRGRILLLEEIPRAVEGAHIRLRSPVHDVLEALVLSRRLIRIPAVGLDFPGVAVCNRCGETLRLLSHDCAACGNHMCFSCLECLPLGEARLCGALYLCPAGDRLSQDPQQRSPSPSYGSFGVSGGRERAFPQAVNVPTARIPRSPSPLYTNAGESKNTCPKLTFDLTQAQKTASLELEEFIAERKMRECLLWAACGAGKTEVTFGAIGRSLSRGDRVLVASPRRNAVMELYERLKASFPGERVIALYGGSQENYRTGRMVVATTHQVMRFYRAFGLMVLDEVDAFPYEGNPMLVRCCRRAVVSGGQVIYLSATPAPDLRDQALRGRIGLIRIPVRHHGWPIPEPELLVRNSREGSLKTAFQLICESLERLCQVFVFVPTCRLAEKFAMELKEFARSQPVGQPGLANQIDFSHSRDPRRDTVRRRFKGGSIKVLVSTTIMERSVTVPRADVVVINADDERVFSENSLVQMAGRAGRTEIYPNARVWFIGEKVSPSMKLAKQIIHGMNEEARKLGYLREETLY